jgi:predicted transcriptional regulator
MIERQQVNLRLERELVDALDDLARTEQTDRTEIARRILVDGVKRARVDRALADYAAGRVTAWRAARDAGILLYEMLDRIHEAAIPYELDPEELARIDQHLAEARARRAATRAAEPRGQYGPEAGAAVAQPGIDELRERYRPGNTRLLFVGESSPAQGTHFYRANSNLYRATRMAFAAAFGEDDVPEAEAFLRYFQERGCWLVDLADTPVNRLPAPERREAVERGVGRLADLVRREQPEAIVVVKRNAADAVGRAASLAGADATPLVVLPFPVRQWAAKYVEGLRAFLAGDSKSGS